MKDMNEITNTAKMEVDQWFVKQCRNPHADFYWYYMESTPEHNGGFVICQDAPANKEYKLAMAERLGKHLTIDQNLYRFLEIARRLPILDIIPN